MKTSVIPAGVTLAGEIEGRGELIVAGVVEGPIDLEGALTIEEGGEVRGDVSVTSLLVRGVLAGTASATESIRVEPSAIVVGDARAPRVQIVEGARFRGRVQMTGEAAQVAPRRRRSREREERRAEPPRGVSERRSEPARPERVERPAPPEPRTDRRPEVRVDRRAEPARPERRAEPPRPERRPEPPRPELPAEPPARAAEPPREEPRRAAPLDDAERPRKRRRDRRPPPPTIPAVQRQTARRKDGSSSSESI